LLKLSAVRVNALHITALTASTQLMVSTTVKAASLHSVETTYKKYYKQKHKHQNINHNKQLQQTK